MNRLAIQGGTPIRTRGWATWPIYDGAEIDQVRAALDQVHGEDRLWGGLLPCPMAAELEQRFARLHGCEYGVALANGAAALELALYAIGLELGDEVITTPLTWAASATCILRAGGVPVFVDVEPRNFNLDPDLIEQAITPRTRAILPVHLAGYPAQMEEIMRIARQHNLAVIEDCAQAHGTSLNGKMVGSFGDAGCFSFQNSKVMTAGEGGLISTNDAALWEKCHSYKDCGRLRRDGGYLDPLTAFEQGGWGFGWNYRLGELQAAVLLAQLDRIREHKHTRLRNARWLNQHLAEIEGIHPAPLAPDQNLWRYILAYEKEAFGGLPLESFIAAVVAEGIPLQHFPLRPVYREGLFLGYIRKTAWAPGLMVNPHDYRTIHLPVAERAFTDQIAFLRHSVLLGDESDMQDIVNAVAKVHQHLHELL